MGNVPRNAEWYLAELVMEITIAKAKKNVVHRNLTLVEAKSPKQAYAKAMRLGREAQTTYDNPAGRRVRHKFRGVSRLEVIVCGIGDGAEIGFREDIGVPSCEIEAWVPPKGQLEAFRPPKPPSDAEINYASGEVLARIAGEKLRSKVVRGNRASSGKAGPGL
jgi:hypothetical protein